MRSLSLCVPALALTTGALTTGCFGAIAIGEDAQLTCASDADCPSTMTCTTAAGRCVLPGVILDVTTPVLAGASSSLPVIGTGQTADVVITVSEPLASVNVVVDGEAAALAVTIDGAAVQVTIAADDRAGSGEVVLFVDGADAAGNSVSGRVDPALRVDLDAPDVVADAVVVNTSVDNALFPGAAAKARADSTVSVSLTFDEAPARVDAVELRSGDQVNAPAVLVDLDGARASFSLAAADIAGLADGDVTIAVAAADDVGNEAVRTLASLLVIDTTRPAAPTLSTLRRAPFGDEDASTATRAEGSAADGILVLALPAGVDVDPAVVPAHVARAAVLAGAFVVDVGLDVPGLRVVAVDDAGNLSEPASAASTVLVASVQQAASPHQLIGRPVVAEQLVQRGDRRIDEDFRAAGSSVTTSPRPFWTPLTTRRDDARAAPPAMARDPTAGGVLLLAAGETFRSAGAQVERVNVPPLPIVRRTAIALDERRGRVVLFGGEDGSGNGGAGNARNDLFEWDGARWQQILTHDPGAADRPAPRMGHGMAYVEALGGVVIVNGCGADVDDFLGCGGPLTPEVWLWDGADFTRLCRGAGDDAGQCGDVPFTLRPGLAVDAAGQLVAYGGAPDEEAAFFPLPLPALVRRFENGRFESYCAGDCAANLPLDGALAYDLASDRALIIGTCQDGAACVASVDVAAETSERTNLAGAGLPADGDVYQPRAVAALDGRLLLADQGRVLALDDDRALLGELVPSSMTARAGGAVAVVDDEVIVVGGCSAVRFDLPIVSCNTALATIEAPLSVFKPRAGSGPDGETIAVPFSGDTLLISRLVAGSAVVRRASDIATAVTVDLGTDVVPLVAFPRATGDRAALVQGNLDFNFPPSLAVRDAVVSIDAAGALAGLCASSCGLPIGGPGLSGAATRGSRGVVFGDNGGGGVFTVVVGDDGVGSGAALINPAVRPPGRRFASAAYDPEREVTWFFGGTTVDLADELNPDNNCGVLGGPPECRDLWRFDGTTWSEVEVVDVTGFGAPDARALAQLGSTGGGAVLSGGAFGGGFPGLKTDAWQLSASSLARPTHQLHASFAPYGPDALQQDVETLEAHWCGEARDNAGVVDVVLRAFVGAGWQELDASDGDVFGCVTGRLDLTGILDVVLPAPELSIVIEAVPQLAVAGLADPTLTTTSFTVTAGFAPR